MKLETLGRRAGTVCSLAAACALLVTRPASAEQYLCVPDQATGFFYDETAKEWLVTKIKAPQFVISPSKRPDTAYDIRDIPSDDTPSGGSSCRKDFNSGMLFCDVAWGGTVSVNKANGRFVRSFTGAYWNVGIPYLGVTDENTGTPMISIGKCTAF
jgi:hypothetical protein